jgi:integrase/recombinase XerD
MNIQEHIEREGFRRGLRPETIKTYAYAVGKFLRIYKKQPHEMTKQDVEQYILQLIKWNRSGNTINVHVHALKFFYEKVLGKRLMINIPKIRVRKRFPEYLTQQEMKTLCTTIQNSKHWLLIVFTYGSGFRVSEIINLKGKDIDLQAGYGWVRNGKGGKDRMFIIPDRLKDDLKQWIQINKVKQNDWLFKGNKGQHYSDSSIRVIIKNACKKANIIKNVSPHTLRHSFATHLLQNGYSLMEVQSLLGHSRIETTMVYTHLAKPKLTNVKSPYDILKDKGDYVKEDFVVYGGSMR